MAPSYARNSDGRSPISPSTYGQASPPVLPGKSVAFELIVTNSHRYTARLPMKVKVHSHDTIESIVCTVKNFYGLYDNPGQSRGRAISFEDKERNTLIVRYENLSEGMTVFVRVSEDPIENAAAYTPQSYDVGAHANPRYGPDDVYHMPPPQPAKALSYGQTSSRPGSRASHHRSVSPVRGRRHDSLQSDSALPTKKARSRSGYQSRPSSTHGNSFDNIHSDGLTGYSSGDGASGSVSSKVNMGNTEISLDNIVEGGRRKRAKFESSELPLFAPPQMPAATSNSSVSPVRRIDLHRASYPFPQAMQHPFANPQPMQSPQGYNTAFGQPGLYATPASGSRRIHEGEPSSRSSYGSTPNGNASDILPTPEPTIIGSCVSEEDKDVAIQLMRLGDMSNVSHGRTSANTLEDGFSGRADATSSAGATSESDSELPLAKRPKREPSPILPPGVNRTIARTTHTMSQTRQIPDYGGDVEYKPERRHNEFLNDMDSLLSSNTSMLASQNQSLNQSQTKPRHSLPSSSSYKVIKPVNKPRTALPSALPISSKLKTKAHSVSENPISPNSMTSHSRKVSAASALNFQHELRDDEEDLSSKPRCQRCRKSKKGCDRQRPCQRCKDAGLSADQCISEDEGNGRKGRYGRHMGVPVKKEESSLWTDDSALEVVAGEPHPDLQFTDKNKPLKRKR